MARHRSRSSGVVSQPLFVVTNGGGAAPNGPYLTAFKSESMDDVVTPGYAKRITAGEIINSPCKYTLSKRETLGSGSATYSTNSPGYVITYSGPLTAHIMSTYGVSSDIVSDINLQALIDKAQLHAVANMDKPAIETGEDLLELKETLQLLRSPLKGINQRLNNVVKAYNKSVRTNRSSQVLTLAEFLAGNWVEYRFAFAPLVRSICDITAEITKPTKKPPELRRSHGRASDEFKGSSDKQAYAQGATMSFSLAMTHSVDVHASIIYRINRPDYGKAWRFGVRAKDFPKNFWAVMPLSFMVDRVSNISAAISAVSNLADPSLSILAGSIRVKDEKLTSATYHTHVAPGWTNQVTPDTVSQIDFEYRRAPWSPAFSDINPGFKPLGLVRDLTSTLDLASLILQRLL